MQAATTVSKQFRVKQCQSRKARNIVTVPDADNPAIRVCPKCGEHPGIIQSYRECPHSPIHAWSERGACVKAQGKSRKRQKQVFSTGEIPHLWAHRVQESARNAQGNLFFEDSVIFSYGHHFPIARHVETKRGRKAILFTRASYSVTTSGHMNAVRSAIPQNVPVFDVAHVGLSLGTIQHAANLQAYVAALEQAISKAQKARMLFHKQWQTKGARELRTELLAYVQFFGLKRPANVPDVPRLTPAMARKMKAREDFLKSGEHQATLVYDRARREMLEDFRSRAINAERVEAWKRGENVYFTTRNLPTMLRVNGDEIETSLGARVPLDHAKRVLAIVRRMVSERKTFQTNGHTIPIGVYKVDRIDADGTLHAGCHHIPFAEIERIAPQVEAYAAGAA